MDQVDADVIIIGAGFAGLSAALFLGNARRKTILVDGGYTRNWNAKHAHNVLGQENKKPRILLQQAWQEVSSLPSLKVIKAQAIDVSRPDKHLFQVLLDNGMTYICRKLILATGLIDVLPDISGIEIFWPNNLFHCPYCVAPELIDQPLGVICETEEAFFLSSIVHKWTDDLILYTNNSPAIPEEERQKMLSKNILVISDSISEVSGQPGQELILHFQQREDSSRRGVFMHLPVKQRAENLLLQLNILVNDASLVLVDETFQTTVPGLYAIGDMSQTIQKVTTAISSGTVAGFEIDHQLTEWEMEQ